MKLFLILFIVFVLGCSTVCADIVGMWLFDDGKGDVATDSSEKKHDGEILGDFKWVDGKFGKAVYLDGSGYVEFEHHEDFNFPDGFTMMIWANIESMAQDYVEIPRKENEYTPAPHKIGNQYEIGLWVHIGGGWIGPIPASGDGPMMGFNEWHHLASTYDGETCRVYVDGQEIASQDTGGPMNSSTSVLRLSNGMPGRLMNATLDEFIMANEAFSSRLINDYMNKGANTVLSVDAHNKLATTWGNLKNIFPE